MIKLTNISKKYQQGSQEIVVLKNINLTIQQQEFVAIMGPSGSGKSTLMNLIGCLDQPSEGELLIDGIATAQLKDHELCDLRNQTISFVFQNFNLLAKQTALQNVELPLIYRKIAKKERDERAKEALARVGLAERMNFLPSELSGGQMQRVAIARALVADSSLILADEPTGALDTKNSRQIMEFFNELNAIENKTIVLITHEPEVAEYASRKIIIRDGAIA